jgi:hypothetical protein
MAPSRKRLRVNGPILTERPDFELSEELAKIDELAGQLITTLTRRRLIALFDGRRIATEIEDIELIRSVWPIGEMPAPIQGHGFTLEDDIVQHTVRNDDLTQRQVLEYLGILTCSRARLFRFLEAVAAPDARNPAEQAIVADKINHLLLQDGYTLGVAGKISGSPYYKVRPAPEGSPADASISATLAAFDPQEADDLPVLYRKLAKVLKLAPDDHTEQVFKQILGSCQSVVESLGALRNKLSDAHSPGPKRARPQTRHAELAVNLAGAMAVFLVSTWEARLQETGPRNSRGTKET